MQNLNEGFPSEILGEEKNSPEFVPTDEDFYREVYWAIILDDTSQAEPKIEEIIFFREFCEEWEEVSSISGDFFAGTIIWNKKLEAYEIEIDQWYHSDGTFKLTVDCFDAKTSLRAFYAAYLVFRSAPQP